MEALDQHAVANERQSLWKRASTFLRFVRQPPTVLRGVKIACIVAPVLTIINQYDAIVHHTFHTEFFVKLALTACVPFTVSVISSSLANMSHSRQQVLLRSGQAPEATLALNGEQEQSHHETDSLHPTPNSRPTSR